MENIIRHANNNINTKLSALSTLELDIDMLSDMQENLRFAGDELQRMENEGGIPLSDKQTAKVYAYLKTIRHIKKALQVAQKCCNQFQSSRKHPKPAMRIGRAATIHYYRTNLSAVIGMSVTGRVTNKNLRTY